MLLPPVCMLNIVASARIGKLAGQLEMSWLNSLAVLLI
jgi:hypothetical protein